MLLLITAPMKPILVAIKSWVMPDLRDSFIMSIRFACAPPCEEEDTIVWKHWNVDCHITGM